MIAEKITRGSRPLILVTNDDGINARGIRSLAEYLMPLGDVVVVAPDGARSGQSAAITVKEPLRMAMVENREGYKAFKTTGTPVDCVKLALNVLFADRPDLVVSGINHGSNSGVSVIYSGTMGAVFEGVVNGIPSIGFSLCSFDADADFSAAKKYAREIIASVLESDEPISYPFCLNVNVPNIPEAEIKGIKVCRQCRGVWNEEFFRHEDPRGKPYFWLTGSYTNYEPEAADTDEWALANGYVSVVPVQVDMTSYAQLPMLKSILQKE